MTAAVDDNIDLKHNQLEESDAEVRVALPSPNSPWCVYLRPYWITKLMHKNRLLYGSLVTLYYLFQFVCCVGSVNVYSDADRLIPCSATGPLSNPDNASRVFDLPLLLLGIFHMIEWLRASTLLTIVCIGVNITALWYITMINSIFGLVAYVVAQMVYVSEDGQLCGAAQPYRYMWLLVEICCFWPTFFLYAFPQIFIICKGKQKADETLAKAEEDEAGED